jgi:hypothetical protein
MATQYRLHPGETIASLLDRAGNAVNLRQLADFNGIPQTEFLIKARTLSIPSPQDLEGRIEVQLPGFAPPNGLTEIRTVFGDIYEYIDDRTGELDPSWETGTLGRVGLPDSLVLGWDLSKSIRSFRAHNLLVDLFTRTFEQIHSAGLWHSVQTFDGAYNYRPKRGAPSLSVHSWGIAVDLNESTNERGTEGDMDTQLIEIFEANGFYWGGHWLGRSRDPMHFQYCTGY